MNLEARDIKVDGDHNHTYIGNGTITINHNGLSKEIVDIYMKYIKDLTDQLIETKVQNAKYKMQTAQYEKELQKLKEIIY